MISIGPWEVETDRVNPRYARVVDVEGRDVCRVYKTEDAAVIRGVPAMLDLLRRLRAGEVVTAYAARAILESIGLE